jgi:hypothetical protein
MSVTFVLTFAVVKVTTSCIGKYVVGGDLFE